MPFKGIIKAISVTLALSGPDMAVSVGVGVGVCNSPEAWQFAKDPICDLLLPHLPVGGCQVGLVASNNNGYILQIKIKNKSRALG